MSSDLTRWAPRPLLALAVTVGAVLVPLLGALVGIALSAWLLPIGGLARTVALLFAGAAGAFLAARFSRRLLGLAMLLRLSLAFPDDLPSRFSAALRGGSTRNLLARGSDDVPAQRIVRLAAAIAAHDRETRGHSERVRAYTEVLAARLGIVDEDLDRLRWAALLHDVGKVEVPTSVLGHAGPLDEYGWAAVRRHPTTGHQLIEPLHDHLGPWADTVLHHHERWDGHGYPSGLSGGDIPLGARIVAVVDAFEVMTGTSRRYRAPDSVVEARHELVRCAGTQFDPTVVAAFVALPLAGVIRLMRAATYGLPLPLALATAPVESAFQHALPLGARLPDAGTPPDGAESSRELEDTGELDAGLDDR